MATKKLLILGSALVVFGIIIAVVGSYIQPSRPVSPEDITPPSAEVVREVQASKGFQYLVVYTDGGFQPASLTVQKGETIRFQNNSSHDMWVADTSHSSTSPCSATTFNSCKAIKPGLFWEHAFATVDTIQYEDIINMNNTGIVTIK